MGVLERILEVKRREVSQLAIPDEAPPSVRPVVLRRDSELSLIAEIKRRSPSAGALSTVLGVAERARAYERAGAAMISVLCDSTFFDGAFEHLRIARQTTALPLLCKDFIIDERQLEAARAWGADAALLIVRCLDPSRLRALVERARQLALTPLVEVTTENEAATALDAGATVIGVNARDLDTLEMDTARTEQVIERLPKEITRIRLSGLKTPESVATTARSVADAALVGEALMRQDDPGPLLGAMVSAARRLQRSG